MTFDNIYNYYEKLVAEKLVELGLSENKDENYLSELCCQALNQLPARYIRYEVDMAFYLPQSDRLEMEMKAEEAVRKAMAFLDDKQQARQRDTESA